MRLDIGRHERGEFKSIGSEFEFVDGLPVEEISTSDFAIAHTFWDSWIDQVRHSFKQNFYEGIDPDDWPTLAAEILDCLETGQPIRNAIVLRHFDSFHL